MAALRGRSTSDSPRVRHSQASALLRSLGPASIGVLVTDPPYDTVNRHGGTYLRRWFGRSLSWPQIGRVLAIGRRRLQADGLAIVLVNEAGLDEARRAVRAAGFARIRQAVWDKRAPGLGQGLRHQVEYVLFGLLPGSRTLTGTDLVAAPAVGSRTAGRYATEKPVGLGRELARIANVRRGELVVDPFAGSGNLLVGALERGARVVAGDTSVRAIRLATRRLAAVARPNPPAAARGRPSLEGRPSKARAPLRNSARQSRPKARPTTRHSRPKDGRP